MLAIDTTQLFFIEYFLVGFPHFGFRQFNMNINVKVF